MGIDTPPDLKKLSTSVVSAAIAALPGNMIDDATTAAPPPRIDPRASLRVDAVLVESPTQIEGSCKETKSAAAMVMIGLLIVVLTIVRLCLLSDSTSSWNILVCTATFDDWVHSATTTCSYYCRHLDCPVRFYEADAIFDITSSKANFRKDFSASSNRSSQSSVHSVVHVIRVVHKVPREM